MAEEAEGAKQTLGGVQEELEVAVSERDAVTEKLEGVREELKGVREELEVAADDRELAKEELEGMREELEGARQAVASGGAMMSRVEAAEARTEAAEREVEVVREQLQVPFPSLALRPPCPDLLALSLAPRSHSIAEVPKWAS